MQPQRKLVRHSVWLLAAWLAAAALGAAAAEPPPKVDWATLDGLLAGGDYEKAATAADEIVTTVKPKRRDPDFLRRSVETLRALMRRGFAELRLGQLDAAAESFDEASKVLKDRDFQRLLNLEARNANARVMSSMVQLEIGRVEVLELRKAVIVERLRRLSLEAEGKPTATGEPAAEFQAQVGDWLDEYDMLERNAREAREALAEGINKGGDAVLASPHSRAVAGNFRPALLEGMKALQVGRLPGGDPREAAGEPATSGNLPAGRGGVEAATRFLREAAAALDAAITAVAPQGFASLKTEPKIEAALMRVDLLTSEGEVLLAAGEPGRAREPLMQAIELRQEVAVLRKLARPATHADLFWPLLLLAEAMLDEARGGQAGGDPARSRGDIVAAGKILTRADELPVAADHPLRKRLAFLRSRLDQELRATDAKLPGKDAADVAARRVRRAIDRTAASDGLDP